MIPLPDDVSLFKASSTPDGEPVAVDEVVLTIHMVDADFFEEEGTDVIDLSGEHGSTMTDFVMRYKLGSRLGNFESERIADGSADGRWYAPGDDDARVTMKFIDQLPLEFLTRALDHIPGHGVPLPAGTSLGDK